MSTVSVSIPDNLKHKMTELDDINWSAVARKAFEHKIGQVEFLKKIARKSKLTEKDAIELSNKLNQEASKNFLSM